MAILDNQPGINVEITVSDTALPEYTDAAEEDSPNTVTKYIEVTSGANFGIRTKFAKLLEYDVLVEVHIDGKWVRGFFVRKSNVVSYPRGTHKEYTRAVHGVRSRVNGEYFEQKFCFAALETDDSEIGSVSKTVLDAVKGVGEISVKLFDVCNLRDSDPSIVEDTKDTAGLGIVPEKALKGNALSHQARFGKPEAVRKYGLSDCDYVDAQKNPFAIYKFRYRSRDALRAMCIIPRTPSPVPLEERNVDELTPEEMRELLKRQQTQREAPARVKQEGRLRAGVKRERQEDSEETLVGDNEVSFVGSKRIRTPAVLNENGIEVVDLT